MTEYKKVMDAQKQKADIKADEEALKKVPEIFVVLVRVDAREGETLDHVGKMGLGVEEPLQATGRIRAVDRRTLHFATSPEGSAACLVSAASLSMSELSSGTIACM